MKYNPEWRSIGRRAKDILTEIMELEQWLLQVDPNPEGILQAKTRKELLEDFQKAIALRDSCIAEQAERIEELARKANEVFTL